MTNLSKEKYRPVLTAEQIEHIIYLAKNEQPLSSKSIGVISKLAPFLTKIQNAGITPAYTTNDKPALYEQLGASTSENTGASKSKEEYWEECYNKKLTEGAQALSIKELEAAKEWEYLNNLMTPEEKIDFENNLFNNYHHQG